MNFFAKLERKFGNSSFPNLIYVIIGCQVIGFILGSVFPDALQYLYFSPDLIAKGQIWRLLSFLLVPSQMVSGNIFWIFITCFIYISIASSLERIIGRFRVNFFLLTGIVLTVIFGFLYYLIFRNPLFVVMLSPYYLCATLFVLFALMFPNAQFLLMFVIPIKGKWMILITILMYLLDIVEAFQTGFAGYGWMLVFMIIAAILNVILFIFCTNSVSRPSPKQMKRSHEFHQKMTAPTSGPRHKCAVCGRTDITNPDLEFRYCSKCSGNFEYCMDHLYTHVHVIDNQIEPQKSKEE